MGTGGPVDLPTALTAFAASLRDSPAAGADLMLVIAHPDDETIGLGGQLASLPLMPIVCLTDGSPADLRDALAHGFSNAADYAETRRRELMAALYVAGYPASGLLGLDIPDQQAARRLAPLARRLADLIARHRPRFVLTHAYEGGHPDHDAAAFASAAALRLLREAGESVPVLVEMPFYHAGEQGPVYQDFSAGQPRPELILPLPRDAAAMKAGMLACHASQAETLAAFTADAERFRLAPDHDFGALPNGGRLQYEQWQLGLTGAGWLELASEALRELGLSR